MDHQEFSKWMLGLFVLLTFPIWLFVWAVDGLRVGIEKAGGEHNDLDSGPFFG